MEITSQQVVPSDRIYEEKLKTFIKANNISCEHLRFEESCHSVAEAARAANANPQDFVKNICMIAEDGALASCLIVVIVKGEDKVSATLVGKALNIAVPRMATANEILEKTGYPCGGTPSFGYGAKFLIDTRVQEMETVYSGGGSEKSLIRISVEELKKANGGVVACVRK